MVDCTVHTLAFLSRAVQCLADVCAEYVCIVTAVSFVLTTLKALSLWEALTTVLPPLPSNQESVLSPALPPVCWKTLGKMLRTHCLIWKMRNGVRGAGQTHPKSLQTTH